MRRSRQRLPIGEEVYNIEVKMYKNIQSEEFKPQRDIARRPAKFNCKGLLIILVYAVLFVATAPFKLYSQPEGGGYGESYLLRNIGSRPISMGGAYSAIVNEPMGLFYNPAGLSFLTPNPSVSSMYSVLQFGRAHSAGAFAMGVGENMGFGIGFNSFHTGEFTGRDARGNPIGTLSNWQYEIVGGFSYRIEFASLGIAAKYLTNNLIGTSTCGDGYSLDLGMKFNVMDLFSFGLAVQDLSAIMMWNTLEKPKDFLPYTIRTGVAMEFGINAEEYVTRSTVSGELETVYVPATRYVLVGIDLTMTQNETSPNLLLGVEAALHEIIAFRGGIGLYGEKSGTPQILPMNVWGGGVSLKPEIEGMLFNANIDYSISGDRLAANGLAHHIAISFEF